MGGQRILRQVGYVAGGATLVGALFGSRTYLLFNAYPDRSMPLIEAMAPSLTDWYLWALLVPAMLWLVRRYPLGGPRGAGRVVTYIAVGAAIAGAKFLLDAGVGRILPWQPALEFRLPVFLIRFYANLGVYIGAVAGLHAIEYANRFRERQMAARKLEATLARVNLQLLRMQLQPHFLFNTLHSVITLMHRDVDSAERMLVRLSDLLRLTIEKIGVHEVPLREELAFVESYVEIQTIRFGDRLRVEVEAEKDTHSARVPLLTLQPLIENSIRHGIEHRATAIMVRISARQDGTHLFLTVEDDGPGLPEGWSPELQGGLGLSNIRERLRGLYGEDQEFTIENRAEGGAVATICIPLRTGTALPPRAERSRGGVGGGVSQKAGVPW